jgi:ATP-dependent Clp protease ATP-binding subunit ClpB
LLFLAHPQVFNVLLQVLDDGHLTDGKGRTVDFSNTIVILTSNLGSNLLLQAQEKAPGSSLSAETQQSVMNIVRQHFRPEFLNRLDDILVFSPLSTTNLRLIVRVLLLQLQARLEAHNLQLDVDDKAVDYILAQSYEPAYGARPIRRFIEHVLTTELSRQLVSGNLPANSNVTFTVNSAGSLHLDVHHYVDSDEELAAAAAAAAAKSAK